MQIEYTAKLFENRESSGLLLEIKLRITTTNKNTIVIQS